MRTLIFSHLYHRPGSPPAATAALRETLAVWLDHLRGPSACLTRESLRQLPCAGHHASGS